MKPIIGLAGVRCLCRQRSRVSAAVSCDCDMISFICGGSSSNCVDPSSVNTFLTKFSIGVDILSFLLCSFIFTNDSCAITNRSCIFPLFDAWSIRVAIRVFNAPLSVLDVTFFVGMEVSSSILSCRDLTVFSRALLNSFWFCISAGLLFELILFRVSAVMTCDWFILVLTFSY